jgi:hypothetical protein
MEPDEAHFRGAEQQLDSALAAAAPALAAQGVAIADRSLRSYHYKNQELRWEVEFSRQWDVGLYTAQVTVTLSMSDAEKVDIALRAQRYRSGQASIDDIRHSDSLPLQALLVQGLQSVVMPKMKEGAGYVGVAAGQFRLPSQP